MRRGIRVKQGKPVSLLGMIFGVIFVFVGLFVVIPKMGGFGIIWTLCAVAIAVFHAYNFFSNKGVASWEVDIDTAGNGKRNNQSTAASGDFETRLRKLNKLKEDGLITEEEFQKKREAILREDW